MKLNNALLISDLHLSPRMPRTAERFVEFCENEATHAEALFILGDLFEYWVGDDAHLDSPFHKEVAKHLKKLSSQGVKIFFMKGNRDFLMGKDYGNAAQWEEIDDPSLVSIGGENWILSHGDVLCTADQSYQNFRRWVRKPWLQALFFKLPLAWRKNIAKNLRSNRTASYQKTEHRMPEVAHERQDVTRAACANLVEKFNCHQIIHGHTHLPGLYQEALNSMTWKRWVLSDWDLDHPDTVLPKANALSIDAQGTIKTLNLVAG